MYLATPGAGKTTLMRAHVYRGRLAPRAFLIVDRQNEWEGQVFTSSAQFRASPTLPRYAVFRGVPGVEVCELAIAIGDVCFVDDECHTTVAERPWRPWDRGQLQPKRGHPLHSVLHQGRHLEAEDGEIRAVHALLATHRPAGLPSDLCSMMTGVYVGRLQGYADAERVYREGWLPESTSPREARAILGARAVGEFSYWP